MVVNNAKLYANKAEGFIGISQKKIEDAEYICDCSDIDDVIVFTKDGRYIIKKVADKIDGYKVADALSEVFTLFRRANKYIDETMPWALAKDEEKKPRLAAVMANLVEGIRFAATLLSPLMPDTAAKIAEIIMIFSLAIYAILSPSGRSCVKI